MWKIAICDDSRANLDSLKIKIEDAIRTGFRDDDFQICRYSSANELMRAVIELEEFFDIAFMDIEIDGKSGIETAKKLRENLPMCHIIFVSGYDEYYLDVYDVEHDYFLKKPVTPDGMYKAMERAVEKLRRERTETFCFVSNSKVNILYANEISHFEKAKRKLRINMTDGSSYEYYGKIEEAMEQLDSNFVQCHNSYIVNLNKVKEGSSDGFVMDSDVNIPISRAYRKKVKEQFFEYLG